ncbi:MAG: 2-oxoglutarate dehydrogenase E1 component [Flavobacteriales bacterium]|nr:2-oxoglutarate dehydrogenase E1 component [Flavobacteriales bacterium]|tara:strand:- start:961 stop:3684 length:2724 start_codon:yes stop_codon:yes gene_type:complete
MDNYSFLGAANSAFFEEIYEQYLKNPDSVEQTWRSFFQGYDFANESYTRDEIESQFPKSFRKEFDVINLIDAYRQRGHLFTKTNPVRERRDYQPKLNIEFFNLQNSDLETVFQAGTQCGIGPSTLSDIVIHLNKVYCQSIGVEYMYIRNSSERNWIKNYIHKNDNQPLFTLNQKKQMLKKLNEAVAFESFIHTKYVGQKRFSLEGGEALIPALDALVEYGSIMNIKEFVIGMAHRGRLNVLANIFKKPYKQVFKEFEGLGYEDKEFDGDVKYHLGYSYDVTTDSGKDVRMCLVPNPSHLEAVGSVMQGISRAKIEHSYAGDDAKLLPIIIHGDAAIAGQGLVFEILQMAQLPAYKTGGSVHIVINNQVGFTTNYLDGRSSIYCTDVAKTTLSPVLHVNGDDVEAVVHSINFAAAYRQEFRKDVFIDLLCYRRYGHNEGDEPRFTQPNLYEAISKHSNPREIYHQKLISQGIVEANMVKEMAIQFKELLEVDLSEARKENTTSITRFMEKEWAHIRKAQEVDFNFSPETGISEEQLSIISRALYTPPEGHTFFKKSLKLLKDRERMVEETQIVDWGMAELMAYGSLLTEGKEVRMTGQDVERGTFSHRHAILRDIITEERVNPLNHMEGLEAKFQIYNSLLSEYGVLGFDYGFAMAAPDGLTIWEAQFGDFSNGAQILIDQYLSAAEDKWEIYNSLVLLLPHGYEGQGAEHSSARLERYLQLCGQLNMQIANATTPANFFHLLRRQLHRDFRKPLVVMSPKSLLRHPKCLSPIQDFLKGSFQEVIDDTSAEVEKVTKLVFCSGKLYYELLAHKEQTKSSDIALVRVEQLYPFPIIKLQSLVAKYSKVKTYIWAQEEPENMGAWGFLLRSWRELPLQLVARSVSATPASGSSKRSARRQQDVIERVFKL